MRSASTTRNNDTTRLTAVAGQACRLSAGAPKVSPAVLQPHGFYLSRTPPAVLPARRQLAPHRDDDRSVMGVLGTPLTLLYQ